MTLEPSLPEASADTAQGPGWTEDRLLGGALRLRQPTRGYRAAVDSVLLGAAVTLKPSARALELGCGAGAALLIAARHNPRAAFEAVEIDPALAALATDNARANGLEARVAARTGEALGPPGADRERFDHVFFNPPFLDDPTAVRAPHDPARRRAFLADSAETGVAAWIEAALARLKAGGWVSLIHRADRLDGVLAALGGKAGAARVLPVQPHAHAPARRVLVAARKGARTPLTLLAPLVLHAADGAPTAAARAIAEGRARPHLFPDVAGAAG